MGIVKYLHRSFLNMTYFLLAILLKLLAYRYFRRYYYSGFRFETIKSNEVIEFFDKVVRILLDGLADLQTLVFYQMFHNYFIYLFFFKRATNGNHLLKYFETFA